MQSLSEEHISFAQLAEIDGNLVIFFRGVVQSTLDRLQRTRNGASALPFAEFLRAFIPVWMNSLCDVQRYLPNLEMHCSKELKAILLAFMVWEQLPNAPSLSARDIESGMLDSASSLICHAAALYATSNAYNTFEVAHLTFKRKRVPAVDAQWQTTRTRRRTVEYFLEADYLTCCRVTRENPSQRAFNSLWNSVIADSTTRRAMYTTLCT